MKILRMKLENFQGVREFEFEPGGESCVVYGDNGTGKSTIYNAFTWLMYGKASTGEKGYTPKTAGSHHLNHVVEVLAELDDGSVTTLRKDYHEVYKTVRGSAQEVFAGHTSDYSVDGVPANETQFRKVVAGICRGEELAKILTMPDYFLDGMGVKDRRKILIEVCGDVGFDDAVSSDPAFSELPAILRKPGDTDAMYTVDEYMAIAVKEKSLIDKELKDIPHRIDEAEKAKPDLCGMDEDAIRNSLEALRKEKESLEEMRAAGENGAAAELKKRIAELEGKRAAGEAAHIRAEAEKNRETFGRASELRHLALDLERELMRMERDRKGHIDEAERLSRMRETLIEEWESEYAKEWDGSPNCPTCGQPLPADQLERARAEFNVAKSKRLEEISLRGASTCSAEMINAERKAAEALDGDISKKRAELEEAMKKADAAEKAGVRGTDYRDTEECKALSEEILNLEERLSDAKKAAREAAQELIGRIEGADKEIAAAQEKLLSFRFVRQQDERVSELAAREKELAAKFEGLQKGMHLCELFTRKKAAMLEEKINGRFETLRFRLFIEQQNGGIQDDCEAMLPCGGPEPVPFRSANHAARVNAGLEVIDALGAHYGVTLPVFIDNSESIVHLRRTSAQTIRLSVSEADKHLRFEKEA